LSGRGLCDELITRPEESYRLCCVVVCDLETSRIGAPYIYDISCLRVNVGRKKHLIPLARRQRMSTEMLGGRGVKGKRGMNVEALQSNCRSVE